MPSGCTSVDYHSLTRQLFIGQDNGTVSQYTLSNDCNSLTMIRDYLAHQARVTGVCFAPKTGWILSCGKDKLFSFHSTDTTSRLGGYTFESMCSALQYPFPQKTKKIYAPYLALNYILFCFAFFICVYRLILSGFKSYFTRLISNPIKLFPYITCIVIQI